MIDKHVRWALASLLFCFVLACDPTASEEYQALSAELDAANARVAALEAREADPRVHAERPPGPSPAEQRIADEEDEAGASPASDAPYEQIVRRAACALAAGPLCDFARAEVLRERGDYLGCYLFAEQAVEICDISREAIGDTLLGGYAPPGAKRFRDELEVSKAQGLNLIRSCAEAHGGFDDIDALRRAFSDEFQRFVAERNRLQLAGGELLCFE